MKLMDHEKQRMELECWKLVSREFALACNTNYTKYKTRDDFLAGVLTKENIEFLSFNTGIVNDKKKYLYTEYIILTLTAIAHELIDLKIKS